MRVGVRLGIDVGKVRVGVAVCDSAGMLATPLMTLERKSESLLSELSTVVQERNVIEIIVGLPLNMSGEQTASTRDALALANDIQVATGLFVRMVDERLSTVSAHSVLRLGGKKQHETRSVIDQVAAVMVLQQAIDTERSTQRAPGILLDDLAQGD